MSQSTASLFVVVQCMIPSARLADTCNVKTFSCLGARRNEEVHLHYWSHGNGTRTLLHSLYPRESHTSHHSLVISKMTAACKSQPTTYVPDKTKQINAPWFAQMIELYSRWQWACK